MNLRALPILCSFAPQTLPDVEIRGITENSQRVEPGYVFVAAPGVRSDGHAYAGEAAARGAVAVIGDRPDLPELEGLPYLRAASPRQALGLIAHALHGNPSRAMKVVGVTGTNGKSSTVILTQQVLHSAGYRAAAFGTLGYDIGGQVIAAKHTTPFGEDLAAMFAQARDAGMSHAIMEVSSHSLDQDRVAGIEFDAAAFTNLTQDHLDYHADMDRYREAKLRLFRSIEGPDAFTAVNTDDPSAAAFFDASPVRCYTFGRQGECHALNVRSRIGRTEFTAVTPWGEADITMTLLGAHNVSNALCVIALCGGLGLPMESIAHGIGALTHVPGRFEAVNAGQDFQVVVDYAHTDDGLKNVLAAARDVCQGRLIVVFGCGGDRDRTKRPKMGAVAGAMADFVVVTSDNPRTEDPLAIITEILPGVESSGKTSPDTYVVIPDRAQAIAEAIAMARAGDFVLLAGKGHEDYQILGTERIHFDDREEALKALEGRH